MASPSFVIYDNLGVPQIVYLDAYGRLIAGPVNRDLHDGMMVGDVTDRASYNNVANELNELANLHNTLLVNNLLVSSGTGNDTAAQQPTYTVKRPWLDMPEGGVPFDPQESVTIDTTIPSQTVIVTLVVPDGYDGVINAYSWNFTGGGFVNGDGSLQAQILNNGAAVRNYDNILTEKGTPAIPRPISPLRIYSGRTYKLVVNHLGNPLLNGNGIGGFSGYFYPSMS